MKNFFDKSFKILCVLIIFLFLKIDLFSGRYDSSDGEDEYKTLSSSDVKIIGKADLFLDLVNIVRLINPLALSKISNNNNFSPFDIEIVYQKKKFNVNISAELFFRKGQFILGNNLCYLINNIKRPAVAKALKNDENFVKEFVLVEKNCFAAFYMIYGKRRSISLYIE